MANNNRTNQPNPSTQTNAADVNTQQPNPAGATASPTDPNAAKPVDARVAQTEVDEEKIAADNEDYRETQPAPREADIDDVIQHSKDHGQVLVGCRLPFGIVMRTEDGREAELAGSNASAIIGGYGVTSVDKDLAETWFAEQKGHKAVRNELVFLARSQKDVERRAREGQETGVKHDLDGLDEQKPYKEVTKADKS